MCKLDAVHMNYTEKFGEWHLLQQRIKCWSKNAFFRTRMTFCQSLLVTNGEFKLDYASMIFVAPGVQIEET